MTFWVEEKACAKINLALHVLGRRPDGYHMLDSVVAFADIADVIKLRRAKVTTLTATGPFAAFVPAGQDNIIYKALGVAQKICDAESSELPSLEIFLEKNLPVAAGIGGGSADAAALLRALFRMTNISLTSEHISSLALSLGADVPVCYLQKPARMQGIGEVISLLTIEIPPAIVLINPLVPSSTHNVFNHLGLEVDQSFRNAVNLAKPPEWRNDLTVAAIASEPAIAKVLAALQAEPCFSAVRMSGSGATCFGLAAGLAEANAAAARLSVKNPNWWVRAASLC